MLAVIYLAFNSRGQFYPAMVYLSTSKINLVQLLNMGLVFMCTLWQITKRIFLGSLREAEVERLNEQSWREVMEILFAITIFRQDFSVPFLAMATALLLIKALHWLSLRRVEYIETTPSVPMLSHVRIVSFPGFLLLLDCLFLSSSIKNYGVPLHLIRELYETFRNFKIRVADYMRYRKIASNMNDRFPDATPEELTANDATCIICREEMTTAKKLICGHLFHVHCLRSWLERQHTCPTCRALVVPHPKTEQVHPMLKGKILKLCSFVQGSGTSSARQGSAGDMAADNLTQHQARLQAAASAASIYQRSCVYPSANTLVWSAGYVVLPKAHGSLADSTKVEANGASTSTGEQVAIPGGQANMPFPQFPHYAFVRFQLPFAKMLQHQLKLLQMQKPKTEGSTDAGLTSSSDRKGKTISSSSSGD
ncbi:ERAD-associated E3 ubiquitin-protein ligase HRD1B [Hibiscus syriacus]|uniref:RING-type E3 ubiquitin transferase n=1 Tax=Hibiscus syriacus TaxID=106335 RepID=A0A6A2XKU4_HIBSY|nr:ERAD-associated E3 ubiquitin-protein ligase HRD1B [Hibiscus syriacus]